jgi:hypothetical protein
MNNSKKIEEMSFLLAYIFLTIAILASIFDFIVGNLGISIGISGMITFIIQYKLTS